MRLPYLCSFTHRLGISKIKVELDDLALRYLEPEAYYDLVEKLQSAVSNG